ncbi:SRR1-domain-containing protein [Cerioporus squamosus]|nr:SRR1-domain-containing protein [Cerioporus squamosus]
MAQHDAQFGYDDHFTPARTRKKRKNRPPTEPPSPSVLLDKASEELAPTDWLRDTMQTLRESLEEAFPPADDTPDVLCLGLGSPSSSRDARAQLAFLLAACDDLRIDRTKVSVFDPVLTEQDLQLLAQRGLTPIPENRTARHALESPTIAFMPHCDLHLYENLLRENWSRERLPNVLLIANPLSEYAERIPSRRLAVEHPCVARLAPYLTSRPLRPCAPYPTAFNNTAVQFVRASALAERDAEWWTLPALSPVPAGRTASSSGPAATPPGSTPPPRSRSPSANPGLAQITRITRARGATPTSTPVQLRLTPMEMLQSRRRRSRT